MIMSEQAFNERGQLFIHELNVRANTSRPLGMRVKEAIKSQEY